MQSLDLIVYSIKYFEMTDHKVMSLMASLPCAQITLDNLACNLVQRYVSAINGTSRNYVEEANICEVYLTAQGVMTFIVLVAER